VADSFHTALQPANRVLNCLTLSQAPATPGESKRMQASARRMIDGSRHLREICAEHEGRRDQEKLPRRRFLYLSGHCHSSGRVPDSKVNG
jgi:hypothetical protein